MTDRPDRGAKRQALRQRIFGDSTRPVQRRGERVTVWVTPAQRRSLEEAAKKANQSLSQWCRGLLTKEVKAPPAPLPWEVDGERGADTVELPDHDLMLICDWMTNTECVVSVYQNNHLLTMLFAEGSERPEEVREFAEVLGRAIEAVISHEGVSFYALEYAED